MKNRKNGYILILEDDSHTRELMRVILKEEGFISITADTCTKAIKIANCIKKVSLVIADYRLRGDETCISFTEFIHERTPFVPILLITASSFIEDHIATVRPAGALKKPFSMQDLINAVNKYFLGEVEHETYRIQEEQR